MIVYSGTKDSFGKDIINGVIARKIDTLFKQFGITHESIQEFNS